MAPQPTPSDLHVDSLLTDMSVGWVQEDTKFVADKVFPRKPVMKQSDKYAIYTQADLFRDDMQKRATASSTPGTAYTVSEGNYFCEDWGLHHDIDDRSVANADSVYNLAVDATRLLTHKELIKREVEWVAAFFGTGVWGTDVTGGTHFTQWSAVNSTPLEDITGYREDVEDSTGLEPNTLVIGKAVWNVLKNHPDILSRISGGATTATPAMVRREQVAALMELDNIYVSSAVRNTAALGSSASMSRVAGKHALLVYVDPSPGLFTPTAGVTFVWDQYIGSAEGRRIKRWRIEDIESERVEIQANWDQKVVASALGLFMASAVA